MNKPRRLLFLALGLIPGVAKAQIYTTPCWNGARPCVVANNRCPLCGTMAEPYVREMGLGIKKYPEAQVAECKKQQAAARLPLKEGELEISGVMCLESHYAEMPIGPKDRVTRCKRCNSAFWQDAEE